MWDVLHTVAAGYPVTKYTPNTEKEMWAKRYRLFFESLKFVLPFDAWRDTLQYAYETPTGHVTEKAFREINEAIDPKKALSRKVFAIHDIVNNALGKKVHRGSYDSFFDKYRLNKKLRSNANSSKAGQAKTISVPIDPMGVKTLMELLEKQDSAMNMYLRDKIPGYGGLKRHQQKRYRSMYRQVSYLKMVAEWWWERLVPQFAGINSAAVRRERVVDAFLNKYQRARYVPLNTLKNIKTFVPSLR